FSRLAAIASMQNSKVDRLEKKVETLANLISNISAELRRSAESATASSAAEATPFSVFIEAASLTELPPEKLVKIARALGKLTTLFDFVVDEGRPMPELVGVAEAELHAEDS